MSNLITFREKISVSVLYFLVVPFSVCACVTDRDNEGHSVAEEENFSPSPLDTVVGVLPEDDPDSTYHEELSRVYDLSQEYPKDSRYVREFFEIFPSEFSTVAELYDIGGPLEGGPSYTHIRLLSSADTCVGLDKFIQKFVGLCLEGNYRVSGGGALQKRSFEKFEKYPKEFCKYLSGLSTKEVHGFFHFFFEAIHPEVMWRDGFPFYILDEENDYPEVVEVARKEYKKLVTDFVEKGKHQH